MKINEKVLSLLEKMEENTRGMSEAVKEAEKSVSALEKSLTSAGDASQDAGNKLSEIGGTLSTISDVGGSVTDVIGSIAGNALKSIPVIGNVLSVVGLVGSALSEIGSIMGETESQQQKLNDAIMESRKVYKEMMQDVAAEFNTQHTMLENTENLISKYQELRDITDLSAGKQLDFYNVVDQLAEHLPDATKLLWEQNDAYKVQLATLKDINEQRSVGIVSGYIEAAQQELSDLEKEAWDEVLGREEMKELNAPDLQNIRKAMDRMFNPIGEFENKMLQFLNSQEKFNDLDQTTKKNLASWAGTTLKTSNSWEEFENNSFWKTAEEFGFTQEDREKFKRMNEGSELYGLDSDYYRAIKEEMGIIAKARGNIDQRYAENKIKYDTALGYQKANENGEYIIMAFDALAEPHVINKEPIPEFVLDAASYYGVTYTPAGRATRMSDEQAAEYLDGIPLEERIWNSMTDSSKEDITEAIGLIHSAQSLLDFLALSEGQQLLPEEQNIARSALFGLQEEGYLEGETLPTLTSEDLDALIAPLVDQNYSAFTEWFDLAAGQVSTLLDDGSKSLAEELQETVVTPLGDAIEKGTGSIDSLTSVLRRGIPLGKEVFGEEEGEEQDEGAANNALGTSYFGGGMTWVGEHGPELMDLPAGSKIYSNSTSKNMSAGGGNIYITVQNMQVREEADIEKIAAQLVEKLEETIFNMP